MKLKQLIKVLDTVQIDSIMKDFEVKGISCDSQKVYPDYVFVAIKGSRQDGHQFIQEAIEKGAKAIIVEDAQIKVKDLRDVQIIRFYDSRRALARLAAEFYGNPFRKLKVVGITGTNGKTTVSYLVEALLKKKQLPCAVLGTVNYRFKDKIIPAKNTTPGPLELQSLFAEMQRDSIKFVVMEVSSHAISQDRIEGIGFHSAIFTNLTQDHLDYHKTIKDYFQTKSKLFKGLSADSFAVLNNDNIYSRRLKNLTSAKIISYGIENKSDIFARNINFNLAKTKFLLITPKGEINLETQLIGKHNVYNILASVSWAQEVGIDLLTIKSVLEEFSFVPGRLEKISNKGGFSIFVDYAHTEDALQNVIKSLREVSGNNRIIVVFGCGGERDKDKRPKMGRVVSELADYAIITNDNPRSEDPQEIIGQIKKGIKKNNYYIIPERLEAIRKSLILAKKGDIVLIAGKGHENYQILKDRAIHFDDREAVKECLRSMNY
jgi:UDP-N-acetylmuramoyl-L-alanyl-D-glutamate--2,6-diaminopimelate ligase